jgi:TM2 domain-containing membrane protein YozV
MMFMNRAAIAALLSALVFPGAGHFYLRRARRAWLFLVPALAGAIVWLGNLATQVSALLDQVLAGTLAPDPVAIAARLEAQGGQSPLVTFAAILFAVCWVAAIIDAIAVARSARPRVG